MEYRSQQGSLGRLEAREEAVDCWHQLPAQGEAVKVRVVNKRLEKLFAGHFALGPKGWMM